MWICKKKKHTMTVTLRNDNLSLTLMDKLTEAYNTTRQVSAASRGMAECRQLGNPLPVLMAADAMGTEYRPTHNVRRACILTCQKE
jgi:hypothetical protein